MRIIYTAATALGCAAASSLLLAGPASALSGNVVDHNTPHAGSGSQTSSAQDGGDYTSVGGPATQRVTPEEADRARKAQQPRSAQSAPKAQAKKTVKPGPQPRGIDRDQTANARIIIGVGKGAGMSDDAIIIALMTAKQESDLYNIRYGDKDSVGLFQQRPKYNWGSKSQIMDRTYSAKAFYGVNPKVKNAGLKQIPGWQKMSKNNAAQAVQRSGHPHRYAQWEGLATALLNANRDAPAIR
ncbi:MULTISPECIES: hypothetical protein [unclassified Brevibacterium]|uniref:hypothetical protein n=1 Tax=unclassified Brevibacterium TaxID=2614124 RepID=UPI0008BFA2F4|nr:MULTISPECIES: hypothetical protein [unclassified Brevibacterium]OFL68648.1 hypothetical protein HMPREF2757_08460 [Brevibacterium sp. HMSC063G07]OFS25782.1 hypothetical protein HMPREF3162_07500 [Brevibacterium sp. HMSC07C04]